MICCLKCKMVMVLSRFGGVLKTGMRHEIKVEPFA
jgi:hypothetical protein